MDVSMKDIVLVTGADGFVGRSVLAKISSHYYVKASVRRQTDSLVIADQIFEVGEISGSNSWSSAICNVNTVIHLAAVAHKSSVNQDYINEVNVNGTINLAKQAVDAGVKRFIFISTIGVLGNATSSVPFNENSPSNPHSSYAESKFQAEMELLKIASKTNLEVVIIRPVLVYGIGAPGNFGKLVSLIKKTPFLPFALCNNKRSFISVDNLVDFVSVCISHPKAANETFCISDGTDISIREFTNRIANGLTKKLTQLPVPVSFLKLLGKITGKTDSVEQLCGNLQVDSSKARQLLGWRAQDTMTDSFNKLTLNK
jgi:nucleoside-diphosphate-sugar epimerase